jgi:hypothetical protein
MVGNRLSPDLPRRACHRCEKTYAPSQSTSALPLTYCGFFCEKGDLGYGMDGLESMRFTLEKNVADGIRKAIEEAESTRSSR